MCTPAAFVLTSNSVLWSCATNSHEAIIDEHNLYANGARGPSVLKVEITPKNGDYSTDPETWVFRVVQKLLPAWHDPARDEARTRAALRDWLKYHCCVQEEYIANAQLAGGDRIIQKTGYGSTQTAGRDSKQEARDCSVQISEDCSVQISEDCSVQITGGCSVQITGEYSIQISGNYSTQKAGEGTIQIVRWYERKSGWQAASRTVRRAEAGTWWYVSQGMWRGCTPEEARAAERLAHNTLHFPS